MTYLEFLILIYRHSICLPSALWAYTGSNAFGREKHRRNRTYKGMIALSLHHALGQLSNNEQNIWSYPDRRSPGNHWIMCQLRNMDLWFCRRVFAGVLWCLVFATIVAASGAHAFRGRGVADRACHPRHPDGSL